MQARSALLLSTVLAIGSTAQATVDDGNGSLVPEALALHAHVEKLHLVVFATGARSIDIIQAMIVSWSPPFGGVLSALTGTSFSADLVSPLNHDLRSRDGFARLLFRVWPSR